MRLNRVPRSSRRRHPRRILPDGRISHAFDGADIRGSLCAALPVPFPWTTRTVFKWERSASSKYLSSSATASSTVFPSRLISGLTESDLLILILPLPVRRIFFGAYGLASSMISRSEMLTCERRIPICTVTFPRESGRELIVPVRFMLRTFDGFTEFKIGRFVGFFSVSAA